MKYSKTKHFKYKLEAREVVKSEITGYNFRTKYISMFPDGRLSIHEGYAWDKKSGYTAWLEAMLEIGCCEIDELKIKLDKERDNTDVWREVCKVNEPKIEQLQIELAASNKALLNHRNALGVFAKLRLLYNKSPDCTKTEPMKSAVKIMVEQCEEALREEKIEQLQAEKDKTCTWNFKKEDSRWDSSCGNSYCFFEFSPDEFHYIYCPYCGHKIIKQTEKGAEL